MNLATRKRLFSLCDPREPLAPDDARYVDVDAFAGAPRGRRWADVLASPIEMTSRPTTTFVTAQRGAGLTTELQRLARRLGDASGARLFVVNINAEEVIDLFDTLDLADVLFAIVERTVAAVSAAEGKAADALPRFQRWVKDASSELGEETSIPATTVFRTNPRARAVFRARVSAEHSRFVAEVRDELTLLDGRARRLGTGGLAVIFDSLTMMRGILAERDNVLASAERVFVKDASYLELPVHVVYTLPPALVLRLRAPLHFLPQIALFDRRGERAAGFDAAREVIRRRVPADALGELFGAANRDDCVERLITASGGSARDLVRLLQSCLLERALDEGRFEQVLSLDADTLRRTLLTSTYSWLARVHAEKTLSFSDDAARPVVERLLADGAVLRYDDGEGWYDVHPAVQRFRGVRAEMARLSRAA